jgi:hypothetical protein
MDSFHYFHIAQATLSKSSQTVRFPFLLPAVSDKIGTGCEIASLSYHPHKKGNKKGLRSGKIGRLLIT